MQNIIKYYLLNLSSLQILFTLEYIKLPQSLKKIGDDIVGNSFLKNSKVRYLDIPDSVKSIGKNAFSGMRLKAIIISDNTKVDEITFNESELETIYCRGEVEKCRANLEEALESVGLEDVEILPVLQAPDFEKLSISSSDIEESENNSESSSVISDSIE